MLLRISKVTIQPGLEEEYLRLHRFHANNFARKQPGNLSLRLLRNCSPQNEFYLHTWWADRRSCERVVSSPNYADIYADMMTVLLERIEVWMCEVRPGELAMSGLTERLRACGTPEPIDADTCVRFTKITVKPGRELELFGRYERWRESVSHDDGYLSSNVLRCEAPPNTFFVQTWWTSVAASYAMARSAAYAATMARALPLLEERMRTWTLHVVDEDERCT